MEKREIRELLLCIERRRRDFLGPRFQALGLTLGQGQPRILNCLLSEDHITQRRLSDRCFLDVTTLSRTIDRLCEAGLVFREADPSCRRSWLICLTEEGRKKAEEVRACFSAYDELLFAGASPGEMETLHASLTRIRENLESSKN